MNEQPTPRIVIQENGPYEVTGEPVLTKRAQSESIHGEPLEWDLVGTEDADYKRRARYLLCRCGQSNSKPYCDGTHEKIDFDGTLTANLMPSPGVRTTTEGEGISLTDNPTLCEQAGFCGTRFTNVWAMMERTSDPEVRERVRRMIANCPSGRLGFGPGYEDLEPEYDLSVATIKDGPLWVRGGIQMESADGKAYEKLNRMTLCRCGRSDNKPYCDGSHKNAGFQAD